MPLDSDEFDFFVSYARADNQNGWITCLVDVLLADRRLDQPELDFEKD